MSMETTDLETLLQSISLEEKIALLSAVDWWRTLKVERDGVSIPHIKVWAPRNSSL